jgi:hypothetical protein
MTVSTWGRRRRVELMQVERKKMTFSTAWVLPASLIPKRYVGQASIGLASWAGSVGYGLLVVSFIFSASYSFSIFCFAVLNSNLNSYLFCRILNLESFSKVPQVFYIG